MKKAIISAKSKIDSSDSILQKAFNNSLQPNIIFIVSTGRIIKANQAACKLLGYSKKEILLKKRGDIFVTAESAYKNMLKERTVEGSVKTDLSMIGKLGKTIPCEITSVIFKDVDGEDNSVLSIVDLRERLAKQEAIDVANENAVAISISIIKAKSDQRQAQENINWIKSIAKTCYDVIWDWDISSDIISFGKNYDKIFGYKLTDNQITFDGWMKLFKPKEREIIKRRWIESLNLKRIHGKTRIHSPLLTEWPAK